YDSWDAADQRRAVSVILPGETYADYTNISSFKHQKKLITGAVDAAGPGGGSGYDSPRNFIVQRYANVLLMYAEATNELGSTPPAEAVEYVNRIRNRAGLSDLATSVTRDKIAFREAIRTERKYELAFEGFRWFDLVRYEKMGVGGGISDILMDATSPYYNSTLSLPKHYVFPIPQSELDANP
ncbi:RagB/SusD family nutrient uptake outer membrane protein, partial [Parabacteroides distasonis]